MKYHGGSRFGLPEEKQSYIYWLCRNVDRLPPAQHETVKKLISEAAEYQEDQEETLREALCTGRNLSNVAMRHFTSEAALQRRIEKFYKKAAEVLL